jgi:hypothetical protein
VTSGRRRKGGRRRPSTGGSGRKPAGGAAAARATPPAEEGRGRSGLAPSPFPPFGVSAARGLWAVGASPVTLVSAFLSLLASWAAFVGLGVETTPRFLAVVMAISPANLFSDVPVAFGAGATSRTAVAVVVLGLLRSVTFGLLILLLQGSLEGRGSDVRATLRRMPRAVMVLFAVYVVEVGLVVVALQIVAGFLGPLSLLVVVAALYFLAFVPVVAVVEDASFQDAFRRGFRAARLPGTRHLTLVVAYFLMLFYAASVSPFGVLAPATPGILTWGFAMVTTFVHVGLLGALVYRWLAVRDGVLAGPAPARARPRAG